MEELGRRMPSLASVTSAASVLPKPEASPHSTPFISSAEHCVRCSRNRPQEGVSLSAARSALAPAARVVSFGTAVTLSSAAASTSSTAASTSSTAASTTPASASPLNNSSHSVDSKSTPKKGASTGASTASKARGGVRGLVSLRGATICGVVRPSTFLLLLASLLPILVGVVGATRDSTAATTTTTTTSYLEIACPEGCTCVADPALRITCSGAGAGAGSPATRKLSLRCLNPSAEFRLRADMFVGLSTVEELLVERCRLSEVPPSAFRGMTNLRSLTLRDSTTPTRVEPGAFAGLPALQSLDLSGNRIQVLHPRGVLDSVASTLRQLNLSRNEFPHIYSTNIPQVAARLKLLTSLDLSRNKISSVISQVFRGMENLKYLDLSQNVIDSVHEDVFADVQLLDHLDLSHNRLAQIPPRLFNLLPDLEFLSLAFNRLVDTSATAFAGLSRLRSLDLRRNELSFDGLAPDELFRDMGRLETLDLAFNRLEKLTGSTFLAVGELTSINLEHNDLQEIPFGVFAHTPKLTLLRLNGNKLRRISNGVFAGAAAGADPSGAGAATTSSALLRLDLQHNAVQLVDEFAFRGLDHLVALNMTANNLNAVPAALKDLRRLESLDLSNNNIAEVTRDSLAGLLALTRLNMRHNKLTSLSNGVFASTPSITSLDLSANDVTNVEIYAFRDLKRLQHLDASHNNILDITGVFGQLNVLQSLVISHNKIKHIDHNSFPYSLKVLDLSFNLIETIEAQIFQPMKNLNIAYLNFNKIRHVSQSALQISPEAASVPSIFLAGNPLMCDCQNNWLQRIKEFQATLTMLRLPKVPDLQQLYCFSRIEKKNILLVAASGKDFVCEYTDWCDRSKFGACCDYYTCQGRMICPTGCTCYKDLAWTVHIVRCSEANLGKVSTYVPVTVKDLFLDGNRLERLTRNGIAGRRQLERLYLNNSNIQILESDALTDLPRLTTLHLESNKLTKIYSAQFAGVPYLQELRLDFNAISFVESGAFDDMTDLRVLTLSNNHLTTLATVEASLPRALPASLATLTVSDNMYPCTCEFTRVFTTFVARNRKIIYDVRNLSCLLANGRSGGADGAEEGDEESGARARRGVGRRRFRSRRRRRHSPRRGAVLYPALDPRTMRELAIECGDIVTTPAEATTPRPRARNATLDSRSTDEQVSSARWTQVEPTRAPPKALTDVQIISIVVMATLTLIVIALAALLYRHRQSLRWWMTGRRGAVNFNSSLGAESRSSTGSEAEMEPLYDALILYASADQERVKHEIINPLEKNNLGYRLCYSQTGMPELNARMNMSAIDLSRRLILVVTANYINHEFQMPKLRPLHSKIFRNCRHKLIVVSMDTLCVEANGAPNWNTMDAFTMASFGPHNGYTYLRWGEANFWENLFNTLPPRLDGRASNYSQSYIAFSDTSLCPHPMMNYARDRHYTSIEL